MTLTFQIVDDDLSTVLFDFNDPAGDNNPFRAKTRFGVGLTMDLGLPDLQRTVFEPTNAPGGNVVFEREGNAEMVWRQRIIGASTYNDLRNAVARLQQLLKRGGTMKWKPSNSSPVAYISYEPSPSPAALRGGDLDLLFAVDQFDTAEGVELHVMRQPHLFGDVIDSDVNKAMNGSMIWDPLLVGRPWFWDWDNENNITGEEISDRYEAYSFNINTLSTRNFSQVLPDATYEAGDLTTFGFWVRADTPNIANVRAVVRYLNSSGTNLGSEQVGVATSVLSAWQFVSVTTSAAPSNTDSARVTLRFINDAATSVKVYVRQGQSELGTNPTLFREATTNVYINPIGKVPAPTAFNDDKSVVPGGNVNAGTHSYKITFVGPWGETEPSAASASFNLAGASTVGLLSIPIGPSGTTQRKIYRTAAGDAAPWKLAVTVNNNTATTASDNVADGSLGASAPTDPIILGHGRALPIYVWGEADAPVEYFITPDDDGSVTQVDFGLGSDEGVEGHNSLTKFLNTRKWVNLGTATLGTDTHTAQNGGAYADIGEGSEGGFATTLFSNNPDVLRKRLTASVTSDLDALVGQTFDVVLRGGPLDFKKYSVQLRWGPRATGGAVYTLDSVEVDNRGGFGAPQFTEIFLGRITLPTGVTLSGVTFEIWSSLDSGESSGEFAYSDLFFYPMTVRSLLGKFAPGSGEEWKAHKLKTPIATPAAGATALVKDRVVILKNDNDSVGTPPNSGFTLPVGSHQVTFRYDYRKFNEQAEFDNDPIDGMTVRFAVWDISTDNKVVGDNVHLDTNDARSHQSGELTLVFKVTNPNKLYQFHAMVTDPGDLDDDGHPMSRCTIHSINELQLPEGTGDETIHTDPERHTVEQLDPDGLYIGPFGIQGPVPARVPAGLAIAHLGAQNLPLDGNNFPSSFNTRYATVRTVYRPRYRG